MNNRFIPADRDALDVGEILTNLRRGRRWLVGGVLSGLLGAALAGWLLRSEYEGTALVLLRDSPDAGASALSQIGGLGGLMGSLPVSLGSGVETELEILRSRSVAGAVVDSLGLQARVRSPEHLGPADVFSDASYAPDVPPRATYTFERAGDTYLVSGPGAAGEAAPGHRYTLPFGAVTLRAEALPEKFSIRFLSRQDAITDLLENLQAENTAGDVAELVYRADDRVTAAAVPNALIAHYLARRTTTDRGVNQRRYEFLEAKADSISTELALAEDALRRYQEGSGVLDPELQGEAALERNTVLRKELEGVEVEMRALEQLMRQANSGELSPRRLAAYPTFLRNPAINDVLSRLLQLETERTQLGQRRTDEDPEMMALQNSVGHLEGQLVSLSESYLAGLSRQRASLQSELEKHRAQLAVLPGQAEESIRRQREVRRLSETLIAVQAQLVQARLAAIGEGGDVRQIDTAVAPRKPAFPKAWINLSVGLFGGLLLGVVGALSSAYLSPRVRDPRDAELAAGVPAVALGPRTPLLLGGLDAVHTLLILPVGEGAFPGVAARRIASVAAARGRGVALADLASPSTAVLAPPPPATSTALATVEDAALGAPLPATAIEGNGLAVFELPGSAGTAVPRQALEAMEQQFSLVVVALAGFDELTEALLSEHRQVVLVGRQGTLRREQLRDTVDGLARAGIRTAGVVLHNGGSADGGSSHA